MRYIPRFPGRAAGVAAAVCAVLAVAAATPATASPAAYSSHHHPQQYYLAIGDSLAYGYQPVTPLDRAQGYVARVHAKLASSVAMENLACNGETSTSLLAGGKCTFASASSQLDAAERFLGRHRGSVVLVTIDIGGNDVTACVKGGTIDQACVAQALVTLRTNLTTTVRRLRHVAPFARVIGMNYYDVVLASWFSGSAGQEIARQSVAVMNSINEVIAGAYRRGGIPTADVAGAFSTGDLTTMVPLAGGEVPLAVARICQWTWMCAPAPLGPDIHANAEGYQVMADAFEAKFAKVHLPASVRSGA